MTIFPVKGQYKNAWKNHKIKKKNRKKRRINKRLKKKSFGRILIKKTLLVICIMGTFGAGILFYTYSDNVSMISSVFNGECDYIINSLDNQVINKDGVDKNDKTQWDYALTSIINSNTYETMLAITAEVEDIKSRKVIVAADDNYYITVSDEMNDRYYKMSESTIKDLKNELEKCDEYTHDVDDFEYYLDSGFDVKDIYIKGDEFWLGKCEWISGMDDKCLFDLTPKDTQNYKRVERKEGNSLYLNMAGRNDYQNMLEYVESADETGWCDTSGELNKNASLWDRLTSSSYVKDEVINVDDGMLNAYSVEIRGYYNYFDNYSLEITFYVILWLLMMAGMIFYLTSKEYTTQKYRFMMTDYRKNLMHSMAHDLKTPLMAISGYAQNLCDDINVSKSKHYSSAIVENVKYMNEMIENILSLASAEDGQAVINKTDIDVRKIINDKLIIYDDVIINKGLEIDIDGECRIEADENLMKQLIDNLVGNAVKYSINEGNVKVGLTNDMISISNSISELPKDEPAELMKPFVKGDNARTGRSGNGLGLAIVKSIADAHGYRIEILVEDGEFIVKIHL